MPQKRESPPRSLSASSTSAEEEESSSEEEQVTNQYHVSTAVPSQSIQKSASKTPTPKTPKPASSSEGEDSDDDEEAPTPQTQTKHAQPRTVQQQQESESESDSESSSPSDLPPQKPKPAQDSLAQKPKIPKSPASPSKPAGVKTPKRPSTDATHKESNKRQKQTASDTSGGENEGDGKKKTQWHWKPEDEILVLERMIDFMKSGSDPSELAALHESLKKSPHFDVSKSQLATKIRNFKRKYISHAEKVKSKGYEKLSASRKEHEKILYKLSKKIWGRNTPSANDAGVETDAAISPSKEAAKEAAANFINTETKDTADGFVWSIKKKSKNENAVPKLIESRENMVKLVDAVNSEPYTERVVTLYPYLKDALCWSADQVMPAMGESVLRRGLELMDPSKAKELNERWMKLHRKELEIYQERAALVDEQWKSICDAIMPSDL